MLNKFIAAFAMVCTILLFQSCKKDTYLSGTWKGRFTSTTTANRDSGSVSIFIGDGGRGGADIKSSFLSFTYLLSGGISTKGNISFEPPIFQDFKLNGKLTATGGGGTWQNTSSLYPGVVFSGTWEVTKQ